MKKITLAVLLSAFVAAPAFAAADSGFYAGIKFGQGSASIDNSTLTDDSDTGWGILGGYTFTPNIAAEVEYLDLGGVKDGAGGADSSGYSISGVGTFPINGQFSVFGKLGYAMITSEFTGAGAGIPDADSSEITYGLGAQYNYTPEIGFRLGWDKYKLDHTDIVNGDLKGDISLISVGGIFKF